MTSQTYLQPPTPISEVSISDQLKGVIDGGKIPGANRLRATALLSSHFSDVPVPGTGTVDLVVQLPPSGEYLPSVKYVSKALPTMSLDLFIPSLIIAM